MLLSDVHYDLNTLELADKATRMAIDKANDLGVSLIVAGDLHNTKANLRGECVNAMIETFKLCKIKPYILRGNHDSINEKSTEHSLNFLAPYANIVHNTHGIDSLKLLLIAYQHDPKDAINKICREAIDKGQRFEGRYTTIIMHQGIQGSNSGEYIQDKSAITTDDVAGLRVISGHYHTRQTIDLPDGGKWDYIGNPFSLNYAEANDPPKGIQILYDDGGLEFVPTNLRRHIVFNVEKANYDTWQITGKVPLEDVRDFDLVWAKVTGTKEELANMTKQHVRKLLYPIPENFRLDLIPTETEDFQAPVKQMTNQELLDTIIEASQTSEDGKARIKNLWRGMV